MARFAYVCAECGYYEASLPMGKAPDLAEHPIDFGLGDPGNARTWEMCPSRAVRIIGDFQFQQDNRRHRKGISPVTRLPYAENRREERKIEERMGIEFVTRDSRPQEWKEAESYSQHLKAGGNPVTLKSEPVKKNEKGWLLKEVNRRANQ